MNNPQPIKGIWIYKACPIGNQPVLPLTIQIDQEIPDCNSLDEARKLYAEQAKILVDALGEVLPGGIFDAVLVALMEKKVSLFRVPHFEPKGSNDHD